MARFIMDPDIMENVAALIEDDVTEIAEEVATNAKRFAPPTKDWVSQRDGGVRSQHVEADSAGGPLSKGIPDNLRFSLTSYAWDMRHMGVGPLTYMLEPRDHSSMRVTGTSFPGVAIVNCRCFLQKDPNGIRKLISAERARLRGTQVVAKALCVGPLVEEAEFGTTYDLDQVSYGTFFMGKAARLTANQRNRARR